MKRRTAITTVIYWEILNKLRHAIRKKLRGKLSSRVILLYDNVCPHTAAKTMEKIQDFLWKFFDDSP